MKNNWKLHLSMINLWCNKNLVDSQIFLWKLLSEDWDKIEYFTDPYDNNVDLVLLNTCGFLSSWREEMFEEIEKLLKSNKKVCLIWCSVQYYEKLLKNTKNLDEYSLFEMEKREKFKNNKNISYLSRNDLKLTTLSDIVELKSSSEFWDFCRYSAPRLLTNGENRYEYLKIAEWCNNSCAYCVIPKIRWKLVSRPIEDVISEANDLLNQWIEELIIVAQDTMRYWTDFSSKSQLLPLLRELDNLPYDFKYRVLYLYPDILTQKNLQEFAELKKFIPYFDIPLQHISPKLLKSMWRFYDDKMIYTLLKEIRSLFKESFIRTNIIVWFPGEDEEDVNHLQQFLDNDFFDNIALFEFHDEALAPSYKLENKIEWNLLHTRFKQISEKVDKILESHKIERKNKNYIGYVEWIQERKWKYFITVRPDLNCPEIDPVDIIELKNILECFDGENIEIWSKIKYIIK